MHHFERNVLLFLSLEIWEYSSLPLKYRLKCGAESVLFRIHCLWAPLFDSRHEIPLPDWWAIFRRVAFFPSSLVHYYRQIIEYLKKKITIWKFSDYSCLCNQFHKQFIKSIGINRFKNAIHWYEYWTKWCRFCRIKSMYVHYVHSLSHFFLCTVEWQYGATHSFSGWLCTRICIFQKGLFLSSPYSLHVWNSAEAHTHKLIEFEALTHPSKSVEDFVFISFLCRVMVQSTEQH